MTVEIEKMLIDDYDEAVTLWSDSQGIVIRPADSREGIARYLAHNPETSFVARIDGRLVGTSLCGHDGRRGYLYHMAVAPEARRRGIGRMLADRCIAALEAEGIDRCHLFIVRTNEAAASFWSSLGWALRSDVGMMTLAME